AARGGQLQLLVTGYGERRRAVGAIGRKARTGDDNDIGGLFVCGGGLRQRMWRESSGAQKGRRTEKQSIEAHSFPPWPLFAGPFVDPRAPTPDTRFAIQNL